MRKLKYLEDKWDSDYAEKLSEAEKLKYRSNLLGSDLQITNFGGGNTSAKIFEIDPITGEKTMVLWVKGSGGDLGSIELDGFAKLYMNKFLELREKYRGKEYEDEMVALYPLCRFGLNNRAPSIDTPLHGLLPFKNVDHLHSDWATALAAAGNGQYWLEKFNERFDQKLAWIPWKRPGYHLGLMILEAIEKDPSINGAIMASHGIITWDNDSYGCYRNSIETIDALGEFVLEKVKDKGAKIFGGVKYPIVKSKDRLVAELLPFIRGEIGKDKMLIGHFADSVDVMKFVNSVDGEKLAYKGTSCPDHFLRTKIRPLYISWDVNNTSLNELKNVISKSIVKYRDEYKEYYERYKVPDSPPMRNPNPTVVLVPGVGMFSFGKNKKEARITGEFFVNAIHVMEGATALENGKLDEGVDESLVFNNYLALPQSEAFRIEYWALEEAKLKRQPPEKEMARKICVVVGGGNGIGRRLASKLAERGAHVAVADLNYEAALEATEEIKINSGNEFVSAFEIDISERESVRSALENIVREFGGVDVLANTAAIIIAPNKDNSFTDESWDKVLRVNVTSNFILTEEFVRIVNEQKSKGVIVLTSSANAVVPKAGSEPYDVSKAAVNHLIRELAVRFAPNIRVNGVSPASVIEGSSMFPRHRVIANLKKYKIEFSEDESDTTLVEKLSEFYAGRTLLKKPVSPSDVAEAFYFLCSDKSAKISGHVIPVDSGLKEAFLR